MRRAELIVLLAIACGRLGFAPVASQDGGTGSAPPGDALASDLDASASGIDAPACVPCDVFSSCGCPADETCYADPTPACATPGDLADGSNCVGNEDCVPQSICTHIGSSSHGVCTHLCRDGSDCGSASCLNLTNTTDFGGCEEICDPVVNTGCDTGDICFVIGAPTFPGSGSITGTACGTAMAGLPAGSACGGPLDCAPTIACLSGTCRPLCYVGSGSACVMPATCRALSPAISRGGHQIGICE